MGAVGARPPGGRSVAPIGRHGGFAALHVQRWATLVAVMASTVAVLISMSATRDRQAGNAAVTVPGLGDQDSATRDADRVFWLPAGMRDRPLVLGIENVSTGFKLGVTFISGGGANAILIGGVPPCTLVEVNVTEAFDGQPDDPAAWIYGRLLFQSSQRYWERGTDEPKPAPDAMTRPLFRFAEMLGRQGPALAVHIFPNGEMTSRTIPPTAIVSRQVPDCGVHG